MKRKILYISAGVALLILFSIFYFSKSPAPEQIAHQKCPDDYGTDDAGSAEYLADFDKWTNNFYDNHPGATLSDWSAARYQFWVDNNCSAALQRYEEFKAGKADPATLKTIEDTRNTMQEVIGQKIKDMPKPDRGIDYIKLTPDLHTTCPFYEPDGVSYRDCVLSQLDKESAKFDLNSEMYKEIESYCENNAVKSSDWGSLAFISDYEACVYYKLKRAE